MNIHQLQVLVHSRAKASGWWTNLTPDGVGELTPRSIECFLAKLALVHSEVSEACEGHRKNLMDDHLPHRRMDEVELADAIIRILDLAEAYNLDIQGAIHDKMEYNLHRADHKIENRLKDGGKKA